MNSDFDSFENDDNIAAVLAQTDQSQFSFPAGFRQEIEHALSGAGFWHHKNLAPEKYDRLTSFAGA